MLLAATFEEFQAMPAAEVRLPADPFVALARPFAGGQIDDRLLAPLGSLKAQVAEQRQLFFADIKEGDRTPSAGGLGDKLPQQLRLVLRGGQQAAAAEKVPAPPRDRYHAVPPRRPEMFPARLGDEVGVVAAAEAKGELLGGPIVAARHAERPPRRRLGQRPPSGNRNLGGYRGHG